MSKRAVIKKCETVIDWHDGKIAIDDLITVLNQHKDSGATHLEFNENRYGDPIVDFYTIREETNDEYNKRIDRENREGDPIKYKELKLLAELKAKYPNN